MPMAVIFVSLAIGILFSEVVDISEWIWSLLSLSFVALALLRRRGYNPFIYVAILCLGGTLHSFNQPEHLPYDTPLSLQLTIESDSHAREGYNSTTAQVVMCNGERCNSGVVVYTDSLLHLSAADRINLRTTIRPFNAHHKGYARLMYHRGYTGNINLHPADIENIVHSSRNSLRHRALNRLNHLLEAGDARAVICAMGVGARNEIDPTLSASYSRAGASHLLAVSGLHVGIAFLLINLLLTPLTLIPAGHIIRSAGVMIAVWMYAYLCGLAPSAVRAAIMFSLLQLSLNSSREYLSGNTLAATAFAMLLFKPMLLFDPGFQMSFTAVAGIIFWGSPLLRALHIKRAPLRQLAEMVVISLVCSLAVMPIVSHLFGNIPTVGILLNPIVILLATVTLFCTILVLLLPLPLAAGVACVAEWCATLQNLIIKWVSGLDFAAINYSFGEGETFIAYAIFTAATLISLGFRRRQGVEIPNI